MDNYNYDVNNYNQDSNNDMNQTHVNKTATSNDHFGLLSLIFGIFSILTSFYFYISPIFSVSSIVLAILFRSRTGRFEGKAVAGLCLSIAGSIICLLFYFLLITLVKNNPDLLNSITKLYNVAN